MQLDISTLFEGGRIDKRVYGDPEIYALEQERIFRKVWHYAGHESEVRQPGDFLTTEVMGQPIIVMRGTDGVLRAFFNRCPHRGALLSRQRQGNAERLTCSYHAWAFDTCGQLEGIPLRRGYANTEVDACPHAYGMAPVPRFAGFRGFLFVSLSATGEDLETYLGPVASNLVNMIERSPTGEIEPFGGVFRMTQRNNWKVYLENLHDGAHALPTHQSSIMPAREASGKADSPWSRLQADIVSANSQTPQKMAALKVQCHEKGHSEMLAFRQSRPAMEGQQEYEQALVERYGAQKAEEILATDRHIAIFYPNISITPTYMQFRVIVPLAVDRTRVDIYSFRLKGAPDAINRRIIAFANVVNSPASLIRADDLENFERVQAGLRVDTVRWVSAHREMEAEPQPVGQSHAMSERYVRNQFHAWRQYMERQ